MKETYNCPLVIQSVLYILSDVLPQKLESVLYILSDVLSQKLDSKDIVHKTYLNSLLFYITEKRNVSQVHKRLYYMNTDDIPAAICI